MQIREIALKTAAKAKRIDKIPKVLLIGQMLS